MNQFDFLGLAPRGIFDTGWQGPRPPGMPSLQMARGIGGAGDDLGGTADAPDESTDVAVRPVSDTVNSGGGGGGGGGGTTGGTSTSATTSYTTPILVGAAVLAAGGLAYAILGHPKKR